MTGEPQVAPPHDAAEPATEGSFRPEPESLLEELREVAPTASPDVLPLASAPRDRSYPPPRTMARWLLVALALLAIGQLLWTARAALLPFGVGLVLAYLLFPVVNALARRIPRPLAILLVYVGAIALVVGVIAYVVPPVVGQIQQLIASIPPVDKLQEMGAHLLQQYQSRVPETIRQPINEVLNNALRDAQTHLTIYAQQAGAFILGQALQVINTVSFLVGFLIVPIWLFYVLNDAAQGRSFIDRLLHPRLRADFWNIWGIVNHVLGDYVRGQIILGAAVGFMVGVGLVIVQLLGFRIGYTLLLAIFAGITELVPFIGPWIGAIPGVVQALFVSPQAAFAVVIVYVVVQQIENNFLIPRVIGASIGIHPAILTVILIAMGYSFGLLGIIMAAPLSAVARDLFIYVYRRLNGVQAVDAKKGLIAIPKSVRRKV